MLFRKGLIIILILCFAVIAAAQDTLPPTEEDDAFVFIPYDVAPEPIGGFIAIKKVLKYPEKALKADVEGRIILYAKVDKNGVVQQTHVIQSLGYGCDEAAETALKAVKWNPAKKGDEPLTVWIAVPIEFKLR